MTQISVLCQAFLSGKIISIKNAYFDYGISNIAREVGRSIERKFFVHVSRVRRHGRSRYGDSAVTWFDYNLRRTPENQDGINRMLEYIQKQTTSNPKTTKEEKEKHLTQQLLNFNHSLF